MTDNDKKLAARNAYNVVDKALSLTKYHVYRRQPEKLLFNCSLKEDLMVCPFFLTVVEAQCVLRANCYMPFRFKENMYADACKATCFVNFNLKNGAFCIDVTSGQISFVMTEYFEHTELSIESVLSLIHTLAATVMAYKRSFLLLARGSIDLNEFMQMQQE